MDKKTILLIVILAVVTIFWNQIMIALGILEPPNPHTAATPSDTLTADTAMNVTGAPDSEQASQSATQTTPPALTQTQTQTQQIDTAVISGEEELVPAETLWVETQMYKAALSTQGGGLVSLKLLHYKYAWEDKDHNGNIEMLPTPEKPEPQMVFGQGALNLSDLSYTADRTGSIDATSSAQTITFTYQSPTGAVIQRVYTFYPDKYSYDLQTVIPDRRALGIEGDYDAVWVNELNATEINQHDDYSGQNTFAMGLFNSGPSLFGEEGIIWGSDWEDGKFSMSEVGDCYWVGKRSKYFTAIMIPRSHPGEKAFASGTKTPMVDTRGEKLEKKDISIGMNLPVDVTSSEIRDSMTVYAGPMDWARMKSYDVDLEEIFDIGTTPVVGWIIRIFAIPIIWLLPKMYDIIPNYGFVIILLGVLIKLVTYPLSKKTVRSMAAMKELQPKVEKLKAKHKNNPQAQQQAMMKLYKEAGVNPLASCLPMLAQMPLFFALFRVFNATILFRGAPFILWWDDLSRGALTMTDPYMILVVIMVVLMFLQQKISMTDPRNKAMVYIMPLLFGFMFRTFSSGLVIYWSTFSAFSFVEQLIGNRSRARANPQVS